MVAVPWFAYMMAVLCFVHVVGLPLDCLYSTCPLVCLYVGFALVGSDSRFLLVFLYDGFPFDLPTWLFSFGLLI